MNVQEHPPEGFFNYLCGGPNEKFLGADDLLFPCPSMQAFLLCLFSEILKSARESACVPYALLSNLSPVVRLFASSYLSLVPALPDLSGTYLGLAWDLSGTCLGLAPVGIASCVACCSS